MRSENFQFLPDSYWIVVNGKNPKIADKSRGDSKTTNGAGRFHDAYKLNSLAYLDKLQIMIVETLVRDSWLQEGDKFNSIVFVGLGQVDFFQDEYLPCTILRFEDLACCCSGFVASLVQLLDQHIGLCLSVAVDRHDFALLCFLYLGYAGLKKQRFAATLLADNDAAVAAFEPLRNHFRIFFQLLGGVYPLDSLDLIIFVLPYFIVLDFEGKRVSASWNGFIENCLEHHTSIFFAEVASQSFHQF